MSAAQEHSRNKEENVIMAESNRLVLRKLIEASRTFEEFQRALEVRPELLGEKTILFDQVKQRMITETEYGVDLFDEAIWNRARELLKGGTAFHLEFNGADPDLTAAVSQFIAFVEQHPYVQFDSGATGTPAGGGKALAGSITGRYVNLVMFTGAIRDIETTYPNLSLKLQLHP